MTLIKSISGIRGTIGGQTGDTLNPLDIVKFTTAYATFIITKANSVSKEYTAEQLKHLHYDSLLTNNLSINLHTYKLH